VAGAISKDTGSPLCLGAVRRSPAFDALSTHFGCGRQLRAAPQYWI